MHIIQLNRIVSDRSRSAYEDEREVLSREMADASDDPTERTNVVAMPAPPPVVTQACAINTDAIRCFYPRKDNRPGTRITFKDGGGFAVTNVYDEVLSLVTPS
jgi:hypothetical protein